MSPDDLLDRVLLVLDELLADAGLRAALVFDKRGTCIASRGDDASMEQVVQTHFSRGLNLGRVCRDADGSTVLSDCSGDAVRLEAVAGGRYILTLVCTDPLSARRLRTRLDAAKRRLDALLATLGSRIE